MRKQQTIWNQKDFSHYHLVGVLLIGIVTMIVPSCEHEPFLPIDPEPIDTTGNAVDTMGEDTFGIPCDPDVIYFNRDVLPILKSNCAKSGCHDASTHEEDIILDNFQNVISSGIVRAYDLNGSDLYEVIIETDPDKRMPEPPNQKLSADQIALISQWILQGAKDLACDEMAGECDTTLVSYSNFISPLLAANCVGCHSGGSPSGSIDLNSYNGVQTVAMNGRLLGAVSWTASFQPMPKGSSKLSDCTIDKIKAWINDGAPNN